MFIKCIGSGSTGNSYSLISNDGEILLLDLGVAGKDILKAIDFRVSDVAGAVVTHGHLDHSRSIKDFELMGIPVFKPYEGMKSLDLGNSKFKVQAFDLTDNEGRFKHTNADGTECPCYGYLISHPEMGRLLYITDTEFVKWRFKNINHILIGCNYQSKYVGNEKTAKKVHVIRGHLELETVKEIVKANKSETLKTVILCHLSQQNANPVEMVAEVQKAADCPVYVAEKDRSWELKG